MAATRVIAAAANALLLIGVGLYVAYRAIRRLVDPEPVEAGLMLVIAVIGLVAESHLATDSHCRQGQVDQCRGAYLEVLGDLLGSVAVVAAARIIVLTGWERADPVAKPGGCGTDPPRSLRLLRDAVRIPSGGRTRDLDVQQVAGT